MKTVTIREAKAHLNQLIEAACSGEQVVLMRGSKHVAAIVPISEADLELAPRLTDEQAAAFWKSLAEERTSSGARIFSSAASAVEHLRRVTKKGRRSQQPG